MNRLILLSGLTLLLAALRPAPAAEDWDGSRIEDLAAQLKDDSYVLRESASRQLADAPASVMPIIERLAKESDDPEVRMRLNTAAREIFRNRVVRTLPEYHQGRGFLGIRWTVEPGKAGVTIHEVLADTAAERAGLEQGDVILSANGEAFHDGMTQEDAMVFWRQMLPGDRIKLVVKNPEKEKPEEKVVVVGSMPAEYQMATSERDKVAKLWTRYREGRLRIAKEERSNGKRIQSWPRVLETPSK